MQKLVGAAAVKKVTPPSSFLVNPLTPPDTGAMLPKRVATIYLLLLERRAGRSLSDASWQTFRLHPNEYTELLDNLRLDESLWRWFKDKIKYDYNPILQSFTLRMPTALHATFIRKFVKEVELQLQRLSIEDPQLRPYIDKVNEVAGQMEFPVRVENDQQACVIRHQPDAMFIHDDALWPGVVIEVSYSQKRKALRDLADDYILESNGGIKLVIGLNIEYRGSQKATLSTWRLGQTLDDQGEVQFIAQPIIEDQIFRDATGTPNPSPNSSLQIDLADFAWGDHPSTPQSQLSISSTSLCALLEQAEKRYGMWKRKEGAGPPAIPSDRKRRRLYTPEEELGLEEEEQANGERRSQRRRMLGESDDDYVDDGGV